MWYCVGLSSSIECECARFVVDLVAGFLLGARLLDEAFRDDAVDTLGEFNGRTQAPRLAVWLVAFGRRWLTSCRDDPSLLTARLDTLA